LNTASTSLAKQLIANGPAGADTWKDNKYTND